MNAVDVCGSYSHGLHASTRGSYSTLPDNPHFNIIISYLVKETSDDTHRDKIDINATGAADLDYAASVDKVRVGIGTTDDSLYERRHPMVIDGYHQELTYINDAFEDHHCRRQGSIGVG
jgi:hypothetical protein